VLPAENRSELARLRPPDEGSALPDAEIWDVRLFAEVIDSRPGAVAIEPGDSRHPAFFPFARVDGARPTRAAAGFCRPCVRAVPVAEGLENRHLRNLHSDLPAPTPLANRALIEVLAREWDPSWSH